MATKKKSAIEARQGHPSGIIDDILEMGTKVLRPKTNDAATVFMQSGKRMRIKANAMANPTPRRIAKAEKKGSSKYFDIKDEMKLRGILRKDVEKTTGKPLKRSQKTVNKDIRMIRKKVYGK
jgi:hypothetical protein